MAKLYYDDDAHLADLDGKSVAVLGYGSQGHAHALNLRDSGVQVMVGLPEGSRSRERATAEGLSIATPAEAVQQADIIMVLVPDTHQASLYQNEIAPHLKVGKTLMFAHGFNIRYGRIQPPEDVDVSMVAPKAPGHRVREVYEEGAGTPALIAVEQDASGRAFANALAYAKAIGTTRAGVIETTFAEETETDLFGEQAVLCGGVSALVRAGFDTLVEAGYQPEIAYFECLHELKLIVDLMYRGGLAEMWNSVSDTAEHGGYEGGSRVIDDQVRARLREILSDVRDGSYARRWIREDAEGRSVFNSRRTTEAEHPIEDVGQTLRRMMGFLAPETREQEPMVAQVS